jgi:predicted permease
MIVPPRAAVVSGDIVSRVTLPVMLMFVGYRLKRMPLSRFGFVLTGTALRMGGGFAAGIGAVYLLGLSGVPAGVCVMTSLMPAAVNSYILAERFEADAELAAAAVFLGTLLSIFLIPVAVYVLSFIP